MKTMEWSNALLNRSGRQPRKVRELTEIINVGVEGSERLDPMEIHVSMQECSSRIPHRQRRAPPAAFSDEFLAKVDLKESSAILGGNRST